MDADFGGVLEWSTFEDDGLAADSKREAQLTPVVGDIQLDPAQVSWVNLKGQRVPGPLVHILQLRAHRDYGARTHEEGKRFKLRVVRDPARAIESLIVPEVVPAPGW